MDDQIAEKIKKKQKYNELVFKITQYGLLNRKPPEKRRKDAQEVGRQIDVPEAELRNIYAENKTVMAHGRYTMMGPAIFRQRSKAIGR